MCIGTYDLLNIFYIITDNFDPVRTNCPQYLNIYRKSKQKYKSNNIYEQFMFYWVKLLLYQFSAKASYGTRDKTREYFCKLLSVWPHTKKKHRMINISSWNISAKEILLLPCHFLGVFTILYISIQLFYADGIKKTICH